MSVFEKLDFKSKDNVTENLIFLNDYFKGVVTETAEGLKINKELLLQKISKDLVEGSQEKYELNWPGKRKAQLAANIQTDKTLEPVIEDSIDFENTQNLYIEGDNLEVLKILQESYTGKIKCIYIDPPYNTGKDFVYKDSFDQDKKDYLTETNQLDEEGGRLVSNPETSGRYHSNWLSMMYPRLQLARNLLSEDGVIFISIDDNEVHNLRKICDEIFGEDNFVAEFIRKTGSTRAMAKNFDIRHDYVLIYSKSIYTIELNEVSKDISSYINPDSDEKGEWSTQDFTVRQGGHFYKIPSISNNNNFENNWALPESQLKTLMGGKEDQAYEDIYKNAIFFNEKGWYILGEFVFKGKDNIINRKKYASETSTLKNNTLYDKIGSNKSGSSEVRNLFSSKKDFFDKPKPTELIKYIFFIGSKSNSIILDFFSGSATSAHATMQLNAEDGGKRKYIMVQIPEETQEDSEAYKAGYKNICEIGKERIRRAAKKIKEETNAEIDYGFRVLKLADSVYNKETFKSPKDTNSDSLFENNLRDNITSDSLLFATLLDLGLPLSYKFEIKKIENKKTYFVEENSLICCFENNLDISIITKLLENNPMYLILLDSSFRSDQDKINIKNKLQELNLRTTIKVI